MSDVVSVFTITVSLTFIVPEVVPEVSTVPFIVTSSSSVGK